MDRVDPSPRNERAPALFDPIGVGGLLYWYALYGIHQLVFAGMLRNIARAVEGPA